MRLPSVLLVQRNGEDWLAVDTLPPHAEEYDVVWCRDGELRHVPPYVLENAFGLWRAGLVLVAGGAIAAIPLDWIVIRWDQCPVMKRTSIVKLV